MWFHSQKLKWAFLTTFQKISPQYNYSLFPIIKVNLSPLYSWMWFQNTSDHLKLEHFYNLVSLNTYQNFSFNFFSLLFWIYIGQFGICRYRRCHNVGEHILWPNVTLLYASSACFATFISVAPIPIWMRGFILFIR